jgi:ferric-dicitrate binding protein FerR (iron transport regulator)
MKALAIRRLAGVAIFLAALIPAVFANVVIAAGPDGAGLETTYTAVVRRATGDVRMAAGAAGHAVEVEAGDVPESGQTFSTGPDGFLELRFHPDMMTIEMQSLSRIVVTFSRADSGEARRILVREGRVSARTGGAASGGTGTALALEDEHSRARVRGGRVAFATSSSASTILVLEGEAEVLNLKTRAVDAVKRGGKAVAGPGGTSISRAGDSELAAAGLRQNRLEVDFWNPATEEYRTLEIEYEGRPRKP